MLLRTPASTRTDTLCPFTSLFRSDRADEHAGLEPFLEEHVAERAGRAGDDLRALHGLFAGRGGRHVQVQLLAPFAAEALAVLAAGTEAAHPLDRSEEHTSEIPSLMRISYAVFCLQKKKSLNT